MKNLLIMGASAIIARLIAGFIPLDSFLFGLSADKIPSSGPAIAVTHATANVAGQCALWEFIIIMLVLFFIIKLLVNQIFI